MAKPFDSMKPRVHPPDLPVAFEDAETPELRGDHYQMRFVGLSGDIDASFASIVECRVEPSSVQELILRGTALTDVAIQDLQAVQIVGRESHWRRVAIVGGRIASLDLSGATLSSVELHGLRLDYVNLAGADVSDVLITGCRIATIDMPQTALRRVRFHESTAEEVDARDARIEHVDLRGLDATRFLDIGSLRGATFSADQAALHSAALARAVGLDVRG